MATTFVGEGHTLEYSNTGSAISAGAVVVMTNIIGIAETNIAATTGVGSVAIRGRWTVPKTTGAAWTQGMQLTYDVSTSKFDTPANLTEATGDVLLCAVAAKAAASGDTTGEVLINVVGSAIQ